MRRFITAPCVGLVVGALEGGIVFTILTLIDVERGKSPGINNEMIYLSTWLGIIFGGFVGGVIGLVVAVSNSQLRGGLVIGSLAGVALAVHIFRGTGPYDDLARTLAVIVIPAAQSMGLLSAVLTARRKGPPPSTESHHSHCIIS
ncbi:MAG TPA: hypothetical protein VN843_10975 [Anaerolineales bacterium]|nr:hypothetical protein [Anaerolineales bacterium]